MYSYTHNLPPHPHALTRYIKNKGQGHTLEEPLCTHSLQGAYHKLSFYQKEGSFIRPRHN